MTKDEIKTILPHREPMLLVEELEQVQLKVSQPLFGWMVELHLVGIMVMTERAV